MPLIMNHGDILRWKAWLSMSLCVTTNLSGFGLWVNQLLGKEGELADGVQVVRRTDYNSSEVADAIKDAITAYSRFYAS